LYCFFAELTRPYGFHVEFILQDCGVYSAIVNIHLKIHKIGEELINRRALDNIRALQPEGEPDILTRIISIYLEDTPNQMDSLCRALRNKDATEVRSIAHSLKSSSANIGALSLSALFKDLEHRAYTNALHGGMEVFVTAQEEYQKIIDPLMAEKVPS